MKNISERTSMIDLFLKGIVNVRVMNRCRRAGIECVRDILDIVEKYGSIVEKFGPSRDFTPSLQRVADTYYQQHGGPVSQSMNRVLL